MCSLKKKDPETSSGWHYLFQHFFFCFYLFRGSIEGVSSNPLKLKTLKRVQGDKREKSILPWDCHGCKKRSLAVAQPFAIAHIRHCEGSLDPVAISSFAFIFSSSFRSFPWPFSATLLSWPLGQFLFRNLIFLTFIFSSSFCFFLGRDELISAFFLLFLSFSGEYWGGVFQPPQIEDSETNSGWQKKKIGVRGKCVPSKLKLHSLRLLVTI